MKKVLRFPFASSAFVLAVVLVLVVAFTDIDLVRLNLKLLEEIEKNKVDDLLVAFALVVVGLLIEVFVARQRKKRETEIQEQRLRVLKATMRTVHDLVNNFLNNMQFFRLETEDALSPEAAELFDKVIQETSAKLKALGDLQSTPEKTVGGSAWIDFEGDLAGHQQGQTAAKK